MKIRVNILFISLLIGFAYPCSCLEPPPPEEAYEEADTVFSGQVTNIVEDGSGYYYEVSIQTIDVWKGEILDEIIVLTETNSSECGYNFQINNEYLIYGYNYGDAIYTNICTRTNLLEYASEDLDYLNGLDNECDDSLLFLTMQDSWGDGWNGNTFCINAECTTLLGGSTGTDEFCIDLSVENVITCGGGSWQSEIFWTLSDSDGTTLISGGAPFEGCVGGSCEPEITEFFEYDDNGELREYYLYQPNSLQNNAPLVFILHGYSGSANGMISYSDMNAVAEEHGFAVCYPQGISDQSGYNFWNVGYAFHQNQTVDDVTFLSSLANYLQDEYGFDSQNTFVTGFSNGGDMSYMLACQANDVFRAIAPVAGSMMETIYDACDSPPVPVLEIHGRNDNVTLWDGDIENNDGWGAYYGTEEGIEFWVETNGCINSENILFPNTNTSDGSYIIHHRYFDCNDNAEIWLYEVVGGGHDWPGSSGNMDIESSEEIWIFFSQYLLNMGDVNNDGTINIQDIVVTINLVLSGQYNSSADLNSDGTVDVLDIIVLVNIILSN